MAVTEFMVVAVPLLETIVRKTETIQTCVRYLVIKHVHQFRF